MQLVNQIFKDKGLIIYICRN